MQYELSVGNCVQKLPNLLLGIVLRLPGGNKRKYKQVKIDYLAHIWIANHRNAMQQC
jgi:hypothetical protein